MLEMKYSNLFCQYHACWWWPGSLSRWGISELWSTSVSHPCSSLNSSLCLAGGKHYQKITIPIFRLVLQNFAIPGCFPYILFYRYLFSLLSSGWLVIAVCGSISVQGTSASLTRSILGTQTAPTSWHALMTVPEWLSTWAKGVKSSRSDRPQRQWHPFVPIQME